MAQTGFTPIQLYSTSTAAAAPSASNLTNSTLGSELAINITDGKLFYKDNANAVQVIGWKTVPTTAGGTGLTTYTAGDLSYYASGTTFTKLAIGTTGQILTSTGSAPQWTTLSGVAVTTFSAGTTGFTPNSATSGAITLAGTLATTNGGTGLTAFTANQIFYASSTSAIGQSANLTFDGTTFTTTGISTSNNLAFTGTGNRITGDFSNATVNNRVMFQNSVTNAATSVYIIPNGTSTTSQFVAAANSNATNTSILQLQANATSALIIAGITGSGSLLPMDFRVGGSDRIRIFTSGGVSIGNTTDPGATNLSVTGNVVMATSGKGIDFSATAGTGTSELFADYEEGTWTPTMTSASGTTTVNAVSGRYTKIGDHTFVVFQIDYSTNASVGTSTFTIGGLPFTSRSSFSSRGFVTSSNWSGSDYNDGYMTIGSAATTIVWAGRSVDQSNRTNAILRFCADYFTG